MKNKKNKQAVGQKFSIFLNEFKIHARLDAESENWDFETQELIDYLCYNWNDWCYNHGFHAHGKLLLMEINVIKQMIINKKNGIIESTEIVRTKIMEEKK